MSMLTDLLDQLIGLDARAKAAEALAKPIRQKATAMVRERFEEEGADRFVRDGATVSLVKPSPYAEVARPETLCDWLEEHGHDLLVIRTVEIVDNGKLLSWLRVIAENGGAQEYAPLADDLVEALDVRRQPVADWYEHIGHQVAADGQMVSLDGEPIPGVRWVVPEPRSITVRLAAETKAAAELLLVTGMGGAG